RQPFSLFQGHQTQRCAAGPGGVGDGFATSGPMNRILTLTLTLTPTLTLLVSVGLRLRLGLRLRGSWSHCAKSAVIELSDGRATVSSPRRWDWHTNLLRRRAEDSRPYPNSAAMARWAVSGATAAVVRSSCDLRSARWTRAGTSQRDVPTQ